MNRPLAAVTGASAGMGAEFARQIGSRGFDVLLISPEHDRLRQVADSIQSSYNVRCEVLTADLTCPNDLARVEERLSGSGELAMLVNNAGFGTLGEFWNCTLEKQEKMHRLHVMAPMRLCHAALPGMVERNRGSIINVSSLSAFIPGPENVSYSATKAWTNRFTEGLWLELRHAGSEVTVQALCPGYTRTEFHKTLGMNTSKMPGWLWFTPERVVSESLRSLESGTLFVIPGRRNRWLVRAYSMLPAGSRRAASIHGARRQQRNR